MKHVQAVDRASAVFVGRDRELAELGAGLADAHVDGFSEAITVYEKASPRRPSR